MKDTDMHASQQKHTRTELDPEFMLVALYLHNDLPPALWELVDERLAKDAAFFERAWPLILAHGKPLREPDEAKVRRALERSRASIGLTPEEDPIVPVSNGLAPGADGLVPDADGLVAGAEATPPMAPGGDSLPSDESRPT